jgi:hypothetical protein
MKRKTLKLMLHRETLRHLEPSRSMRPNDSCVLSCLDMSCGCTASDEATVGGKG